jgi:hypothetical protein
VADELPDYQKGHHLPNLRPGRQAADPQHLPRQRRGTTPQMIGRYPDFDVLDPKVVSLWDGVTRKIVLERLEVGQRKLEFFRADEEPAVRAFADTVLAQDREPRIPVVEMLDKKYAAGKLDGYQYADMPDDRETWHIVLRGLNEVARERYGQAGFAQCDPPSRHAICSDFKAGTLQGGAWAELNVKRAWSVCTRGLVSEFYSHPWAWNEIGFGGPAYPRGWMRFGELGVRESFETEEAFAADPVRDVEQRHLES